MFFKTVKRFNHTLSKMDDLQSFYVKVSYIDLYRLSTSFLLCRIYIEYLRELRPTASNAEIDQDISHFTLWFKQYVGF